MIKNFTAFFPNSRRSASFFLAAFFAFATSFLSCQTPLGPVDKTSDPTEFESVWQYCMAYSIYQDSSIYAGRIPGNPFAFSQPADIMTAIHDTLKGNYYTGYDYADGYDTIYNWSAGWIQSMARTADIGSGIASADSLVFMDTLSDSTAILTITTFEGAADSQIFYDFLGLGPALSHFKNIIIDLRENLGGYIDDAQAIIEAMVPVQTRYILARERDYDAASNQYVTRSWHPWVTTHYPILSGKHYALVMDGWTASAAELCLAGIYEGQLQEGFNAPPLLGSRSYGKGIGQIIIERRATCYASPPGGVDTIPLGGDTIGIVPYRVNDFLDLKITYLQLQGISARIGLYHDIGIPPDTVPAGIKQAADSEMGKWGIDTASWAPIVYAAKILEPSLNLDSLLNPNITVKVARVRPPSLAKRASKTSIAQVVEKVIRTDKVLLWK